MFEVPAPCAEFSGRETELINLEKLVAGQRNKRESMISIHGPRGRITFLFDLLNVIIAPNKT
jgi:hypothetical protein